LGRSIPSFGKNLMEIPLKMSLKTSFYIPFLSLLAFILFPLICFSQTIHGKVLEDKTNDPLIGANIVLKSSSKTFTTNSGLDGSFIFHSVPPGKYELKIQFIGYTIRLETLEIGDSKLKELGVLNLSPSERSLREVKIVSKKDLETDQNARRTERYSENILNLVSAKTIELSPDITVGNVLQRVSGVSVERTTSGDGQYAIIRGMDKRYSYTSVNGIILPSPDDKNRAIPLDMFPAELISNLEVVKALTPKLEGSAIAGAMNLVMKDAPDHLVINANLAGGVSSFFINHPFVGFSKSGINFKSPLEIYGNVPALASQFQTSQLQFNNVKLPINALGSFSIGSRTANQKFGFLLAGSYSKQYKGGQTLFYEPNGQPGPDPSNNPIFLYIHNRTYSTLQTRTGLHGKFDYILNPDHRYNLYAVFLQLDENLHRKDIISGLGGTGEIDQTDRVQFTRRNLFHTGLSGHDLIIPKLSADWNVSYAIASSKTPDWVDLKLFKPNIDSTTEYLSSLPHIWTRSRDEDKSGSLNLNFKPNKNLEIILGGLYRSKNRTNFYNDYLLSSAIAGVSRQVFTTIQNATFRFNSLNEGTADTTNALNYTATEDIGAGFIQGKLSFNKWQILAGIRVENTHQTYASQLPATEAGKYATIDYTDILPSVHIKYVLSSSENLRLSYFSGISRPYLFELIPGTFSGDFYTESGNYNLQRASSDNLDFRYEKFFSKIDYVYAGLFYKHIQNPIEYAFVNKGSANYYYEPVNTSSPATNYGLEIVFQKYIRNWGVSGNYSYTNSSITTPKAIYGRDNTGAIVTTYQNQTRSLQGQSSHIGNLSLLYKNSPLGIEGQLSLVYTGKRISIISPYLGLDFYERATSQLDFSAQKSLNRHFTLYVKATNLLNNSSYQDVLHTNTLLGQEGQVLSDKILVQKDTFNQTYLLGIRYKLQ